MKTKIYFEIQDNESWTSSYYYTDIEKSMQKVKDLSRLENFKDTIYFNIYEVEIEEYDDMIAMFRKQKATYFTNTKKWIMK